MLYEVEAMVVMKYALENLTARKSRSFLTILSIMIGIAAIFIFSSFGYGLFDYVNEVKETAGIDNFMVQTRSAGAPGMDDTFKLTEKDLKAVERSRGVDFVTYWYMKPAQIEKHNVKKYVYLVGLEPNEVALDKVDEMFGVSVSPGRQFKPSDSGRVVLGYSYSQDKVIFDKGLDVGDKVTINDKKYDIIGFYEKIGNPSDDSNVYLLEDDIKGLFGSDATYSLIVGSVSNIDDIDNTLERVKKRLRNVRDVEEGKEDFFVVSFEEQFEMFSNVLNVVIGFIALIVLISAIVASINTANTMITSVLERVQEIGVMKAIGAKNGLIRNLFLLESSLLGFAAGLFGVLLGWGLSALGGKILSDLGWSFLSPAYPWWIFFICLVLADEIVTDNSGKEVPSAMIVKAIIYSATPRP